MPPKLPFEAPRPEFKYRELALAPIPDWGWHLSDFKSECLREPVEVFHWNLIRTSSLAMLPAWVALESTREQLWFDHAKVSNGERLDPDLSKVPEATFSSSAEAEFDKLVVQYRNMPDGMIRRLLDEIGITHIENHIAFSRGLRNGLDMLFASIVKDSWTAFECLASELWAATLDKDNGTIAARVAPVLRKPSKKVTPTFNIRTHPGSYQIETRQIVFQKVEDIKRLYEVAFPHEAAHLFDSVEGGYIFVLAAFRNILVHKRGRVDQQFLDAVANFGDFNSWPKGDEIPLNGDLVKRMRDAAMELGRKLVTVADKALQAQI